MSVARTTCTDCGLPYYEDQEDCPYCNRAGADAGSGAVEPGSGDGTDPGTASAPSDDGTGRSGETTAGTESRARTTCSTCGLPYSADAGDCPYCDRASGTAEGTTAGATSAADADSTVEAEAGVETEPATAESDADATAERSEATASNGSGERGGLIARVKRLFMG